VRDDKKHRAYHELLGNKTPEEAITYLFLEWFPPTSFFDPKFIESQHLRDLFQQVWDKRIAEESNSSHFCCEKCGGRIVESRKSGQIKVFNCEQCGEFECFSCMLCLGPARILIDSESGLYLCGACLNSFVKNKTRLLKRFKKYAYLIWRIWMDFQQKQEDIK
jgi:hypothetical protein